MSPTIPLLDLAYVLLCPFLVPSCSSPLLAESLAYASFFTTSWLPLMTNALNTHNSPTTPLALLPINSHSASLRFGKRSRVSEPKIQGHYWLFWRLRLLIQGQLTDPSLNSLFYPNHKNLWDNGGHLLMITRQMPTKISNEPSLICRQSNGVIITRRQLSHRCVVTWDTFLSQ